MLCDFCRKREGVLTDRTVVNNGMVEFHFCEECYADIRRSGHSAFEVMSRLAAREGKECPVCGTTTADFAASFMFGCPECYRNMQKPAVGAAEASQGGASVHVGKRPKGERNAG